MSRDEFIKFIDLGVEAYKQRDYEKALLLFDKAIELCPDFEGAHKNKKSVLSKLK